MNEYPILFSGEMVRAILAGKKTQTRRVVMHQPEFGAYISKNGFFERIALVHEDWAGNGIGVQACPYAKKIGDRLWVREKTAIGFSDDWDLAVDYHADGKRGVFDVTEENQRYADKYINDDRNRAARFMPRWACRILLEVVDVRVERLQEVSESDAQAEGCQPLIAGGDMESQVYRAGFSALWNKINGNRPTLPKDRKSKRYDTVERWLATHPPADWASNPWVWVIDFVQVV